MTVKWKQIESYKEDHQSMYESKFNIDENKNSDDS